MTNKDQIDKIENMINTVVDIKVQILRLQDDLENMLNRLKKENQKEKRNV